MFKIQPVRSAEYQAELAHSLGGEPIDGTFSFFAAEMKEDFETVKYPIALCQFKFSPEKAVIMALSVAEGSENDEAVTILVRSVMSWAYRADIPVIEFDDGAADEEYIKSVSFRRDDRGRWSVDLKKFYRSPCHYGDGK